MSDGHGKTKNVDFSKFRNCLEKGISVDKQMKQNAVTLTKMIQLFLSNMIMDEHFSKLGKLRCSRHPSVPNL